MPRKKKYENAEIVRKMFEREFNYVGDLQSCMVFKFLDLKKKKDKEFFKNNINEMIGIFEDALKELED